MSSKFGWNLHIKKWLLSVLACLSLWQIALAHAVQPDDYAYVIMGPEGVAVIRVITSAATCPALMADGHALALQVRTAPLNAPSAGIHPAVFPVQVCEGNWPLNAKSVSLQGKPLPSVNPDPKKIVLMGDSGCRMKAPVEYQACNDAHQWPLAEVARNAAAEKPDLVIHVGDYHYRESPCLMDGCAGSPYGYGWDAWQVDVFNPLRPLMQAAPWVVVRGNHESCARAGEGWFRFLDPHPFSVGHACDVAQNVGADYSEPYVVPLGNANQLIVFDSSGASEKSPAANSPLVVTYARQFKTVATLAANKPNNWLLFHHPILGFGYNPITGWQKGNASLIAALTTIQSKTFFPEGIQMTIQGHVHTFELARTAGHEPLTLLTGFGGSTLDAHFPKQLPDHFEPAPGIPILEAQTDQEFGYSVLERMNDHWQLREMDMHGSVKHVFNLQLKQPPYNFLQIK